MTTHPPIPPHRRRKPLKQRLMERLVRALDLECEAVGEQQYRVITGGVREHYVDLAAFPGDGACDCEDFTIGASPICKHIWLAMLEHGGVMDHYRGVLAQAEQYRMMRQQGRR